MSDHAKGLNRNGWCWRSGNWLLAEHSAHFTWTPKYTRWPRQGGSLWWLWWEAAYVRPLPRASAGGDAE